MKSNDDLQHALTTAGITRGPWRVRVYGKDKPSVYTALCRTKRGYPIYIADVDPKADAMLIAAAPELLAACRLALEMIRRHDAGETGCPVKPDSALAWYCGEDCLTDTDAVEGIGDVLINAIAKAEGADQSKKR